MGLLMLLLLLLKHTPVAAPCCCLLLRALGEGWVPAVMPMPPRPAAPVGGLSPPLWCMQLLLMWRQVALVKLLNSCCGCVSASRHLLAPLQGVAAPLRGTRAAAGQRRCCACGCCGSHHPPPDPLLLLLVVALQWGHPPPPPPPAAVWQHWWGGVMKRQR
jgi:hypothetical protein